jgi:NAD(P)-dependent dehydrogenase (short-subunit alcohol dehydrogenase family)
MKGAVKVLSRRMALELGPRRIAVNVVAPGAVATDFSVRGYLSSFLPGGRLTHAWLVKPELESLFDHRTVMISKILGALPAID